MEFLMTPSDIVSFQELLTALRSLRSRGEIKRWGRWLEQSSFFQELQQLLQAQGQEVEGCSGKQLIRLYLNRGAQSQVRSNPIHQDEGFECLNCGAEVPAGGVQIRDHCPECLHGRHLDDVPGDRSSRCLALMIPIGLEHQRDQSWIRFRCSRCEHQFRVRAHPEDKLLAFAQRQADKRR